jgi:hypothetical protein
VRVVVEYPISNKEYPMMKGSMDESGYKQIGKRKETKPSPAEADRWLKTVHQLRGGIGVCRRGLYRFQTFEEADQWMEMMILSSIRGSRP